MALRWVLAGGAASGAAVLLQLVVMAMCLAPCLAFQVAMPLPSTGRHSYGVGRSGAAHRSRPTPQSPLGMAGFGAGSAGTNKRGGGGPKKGGGKKGAPITSFPPSMLKRYDALKSAGNVCVRVCARVRSDGSAPAGSWYEVGNVAAADGQSIEAAVWAAKRYILEYSTWQASPFTCAHKHASTQARRPCSLSSQCPYLTTGSCGSLAAVPGTAREQGAAGGGHDAGVGHGVCRERPRLRNRCCRKGVFLCASAFAFFSASCAAALAHSLSLCRHPRPVSIAPTVSAL